MIMQKVAQKLKSIRKVEKAQKIEMKMLKKKLQEVKIKSDILEKEFVFLRIKEQK